MVVFVFFVTKSYFMYTLHIPLYSTCSKNVNAPHKRKCFRIFYHSLYEISSYQGMPWNAKLLLSGFGFLFINLLPTQSLERFTFYFNWPYGLDSVPILDTPSIRLSGRPHHFKYGQLAAGKQPNPTSCNFHSSYVGVITLVITFLIAPFGK